MPLQDTVRGFAAIVDGEADDLPEWAFFNVGTLEDAARRQRKSWLRKEAVPSMNKFMLNITASAVSTIEAIAKKTLCPSAMACTAYRPDTARC